MRLWIWDAGLGIWIETLEAGLEIRNSRPWAELYKGGMEDLGWEFIDPSISLPFPLPDSYPQRRCSNSNAKIASKRPESYIILLSCLQSQPHNPPTTQSPVSHSHSKSQISNPNPQSESPISNLKSRIPNPLSPRRWPRLVVALDFRRGEAFVVDGEEVVGAQVGALAVRAIAEQQGGVGGPAFRFPAGGAVAVVIQGLLVSVGVEQHAVGIGASAVAIPGDHQVLQAGADAVGAEGAGEIGEVIDSGPMAELAARAAPG